MPPLEDELIEGDTEQVLSGLESGRFQCVVTSPPYWGLRDYGIPGQIGLEGNVEDYIAALTRVFEQVRRVLRDDGVLWLNIGDGYTSGNRGWRAPDRKNPAREMSVRPDTPEGLKPKDLIGLPWRLAFALQSAGWYLRTDIVWHKPNAMPESVKDRPSRSHEFVFMFTKSEKYFYNYEAQLVAGDSGPRNRRTVWSVNTKPMPEAHFATFPCDLVEPCVLAGTRRGDLVLDPFFGSGTVGVVARRLGRPFVGIELNAEYLQIARHRLRTEAAEPELAFR